MLASPINKMLMLSKQLSILLAGVSMPIKIYFMQGQLDNMHAIHEISIIKKKFRKKV